MGEPFIFQNFPRSGCCCRASWRGTRGRWGPSLRPTAGTSFGTQSLFRDIIATVHTHTAAVRIFVSLWWNQCSVSSFEFLEIRILIQPILWKPNWKLFFYKHLKFNQKEEFINYTVYAIFYFILQSNSTHSPEFTGLKLEIPFLFISSFIFCWIRIRNTGWNVLFSFL